MTTTIETELQQRLQDMKKQHLTAGPADLALRQDRLNRCIRLIRENHRKLTDAMSEDFGHRSPYQALVADILTTINLLKDAIEQLPQWMASEKVSAPDPEMQATIMYQPLGVIGVISPWNFPINLAFGPLAGVFAAGNTAMLKPSELTPRTSDLLAELVGKYFGPDELTVVLGDASVGQAFSALPFDHLVFTGSTTVGKHVMRAAAENLVPVTLELGGKSPVMIAEDADLTKSAERTLTVKTFNSGQICLSPDYVLMPETRLDEFIDISRRFIQTGFPQIQQNTDYTAIISPRHFDRLVGLLDDAQKKGAQIIYLGSDNEPAFDAETRKIAPHLVIGVTEDMAIMQEEIFGPLLPVKTYTNEQEAIDYINTHHKPLAAYYFGENTEKQQAFTHGTTSGGLVINDVMTHVSVDTLPFGGVGHSGMGAYHGIHGFRQFSHARAVVVQSDAGLSNLRLRAPYQEKQTQAEALLTL